MNETLNETITLTFGEQAENHRGMEILGSGLKDGFTCEELLEAKARFESLPEELKISCEYHDLNLKDHPLEAAVLVIRNGVNILREKYTKDIFENHKNLEWDRKAYMYGRVVNKNARFNLCFADESREPDYENKRGRIVAFTPAIKKLRKILPNFFGKKAENLECEGNFYHDTKTCGIGYHGDTERHIVIGLRLGATIPLVFRWYEDAKRVAYGGPLVLELNHGDLYAMSQKATGHDWKTRSIKTLRHAAGCEKFIK